MGNRKGYPYRAAAMVAHTSYEQLQDCPYTLQKNLYTKHQALEERPLSSPPLDRRNILETQYLTSPLAYPDVEI